MLPPLKAYPQEKREYTERRARKRTLEIDREMKEVLETLLAVSECDHVFTHPGDPTQPLGAWILETQIGALRTRIKTHPDGGLHGLRHTFLTEAGEHTDPFTLQYTAGHDNIKTTMRYVHPQANAVLLCPAGSTPTRQACGQRFGAKSSDKNGYTAEEHQAGYPASC